MPTDTSSWKPTPPSSTFGRRFLAGVDPSADPSAPPCGPHELRLKIAALPIELMGMGDDEAGAVRRLYGAELQESPAGPRVDRDPRDDWRVRFHRAPSSAFRDMERDTDREAEDGTEEAPDRRANWTERLDQVAAESHVRVAGPWWVTRILRRERRVEAHLGPPRGESGIDVALSRILRISVAFAAVERGALLLQAAALGRGDGAVVLPGHEVGEKRALAAAARRLGDEVLADELVLIWPHVPAAEQVPFPGEPGTREIHAGRRPLRAVLPLLGTDGDELVPLDWAELWRRVVGAAVFVNADPWSADRLEELAARTIGAIDQPRGLRFLPGGGLPALEEILGPPGLALGTAS